VGGSNNWAIDIDANDYLRSMEKRMLHEERRPQVRSAADLLGPGFSPYSVETNDWNAEATARQGFWWSAPNALNSPDNTKTWMGWVTSNSDGSGIQDVQEQSTTSPPLHYVRTFQTIGGIRVYSVWGRTFGDTGWLPMTLVSGWAAYGTGYEDPTYRRRNGVVYLRGLIRSGTVAPGTPITTLPVGFRPGAVMSHIIVPTGVPTWAFINVLGNGIVQCNANVSALWLSLANISFIAEQ
jgi:hypothetical protein